MRTKINPILAPGYNPFKPETYPKTAVAYIYWFVCWIGTLNALNYAAMAFNMGSFERCNTALKSYGYFGHIVAIVFYVLLELLPGPKKEKKDGESKKTK